MMTKQKWKRGVQKATKDREEMIIREKENKDVRI